MLIFVRRVTTLFLALLFLGGCVAATKKAGVATAEVTTLSGDEQSPRETLELPRSVAVLPLINRTGKPAAFDLVWQTLHNHFSGKNYRSLHLATVRRKLEAAGLEDPQSLDGIPEERLSSILGVDGLLMGEITHYDKVFAGLYAQVAVGVRLRLVGRDGVERWRAEKVVRKHEGGLATNPVGLLMSAAFAAWHVKDDVNLFRAADELGRALMAEMPEPPYLDGQRPPRITHVAHDGISRVMKYGDTLAVGLEGDPGLTATIRIEGLPLIDLPEVQPGVYHTKFNIRPQDNVTDAVVIGLLQDAYGNRSEWVSPLGFVAVDNRAPDLLLDLQATVRDGRAILTWKPSTQADLDHYQVEVSENPQGPYRKVGMPRENRLEQPGLSDFATFHYRVMAVDKAGNLSEAAQTSVQAAPDARFLQAENLEGTLPRQITGTVALTERNGPYHVRHPVEVRLGGLLLIGPGTRLIMQDRSLITVRGGLQVYGTSDKPVVVTGMDGAPFSTFVALASEEPVTIRGVTVRGGGIPIQITAGSPQILDSRLLKSLYSALEISGSSRPLIRGCEIQGSGAGGVVVEGKAQPRFEGNRFLENKPVHMQNGSEYRIDARGNSWQPSASVSTVLGAVDY
ncbi:MAG: DUF799 family lipoprotein [Magnetococcales bacterium]|nr:DUF799 family lipoprotein [Magnetococcales bacterium]